MAEADSGEVCVSGSEVIRDSPSGRTWGNLWTKRLLGSTWSGCTDGLYRRVPGRNDRERRTAMTGSRRYWVLVLVVGMLVTFLAVSAEAKSEQVALKVQGMV